MSESYTERYQRSDEDSEAGADESDAANLLIGVTRMIDFRKNLGGEWRLKSGNEDI